MNQIAALIRGGFQSSTGLTPKFKAFARLFKKLIKNELAKKGCELLTFNRGHFYVSGFFRKGEQIYYFSVSDVRDNHWNSTPKMLYRTAKSIKDYTGGGNQYVNIEDNMIYDIIRY
jgi:hypothetical protein